MVVNVVAWLRHSHSTDRWAAWWKLPLWVSAFSWKRVYTWRGCYADDWKEKWFDSREEVIDCLKKQVRDYFKSKLPNSDEHFTIKVEVPE